MDGMNAVGACIERRFCLAARTIEGNQASKPVASRLAVIGFAVVNIIYRSPMMGVAPVAKPLNEGAERRGCRAPAPTTGLACADEG